MSIDSTKFSALVKQVEEQSVLLAQLKERLDVALATLAPKGEEVKETSDGEKKKRTPMTDEQKKAMAEKRRATLAAKANATEEKPEEKPEEKETSDGEKKKRAPMTEEQKKAMAEKRRATLAAKADKKDEPEATA